jgi:hypothetical protein
MTGVGHRPQFPRAAGLLCGLGFASSMASSFISFFGIMEQVPQSN